MIQNDKSKSKNNDNLSGSKVSLYLTYNSLPVSDLINILSSFENIHNIYFRSQAGRKSLPLSIAKASTSHSILIDFWSQITNYAPEIISALKVLVPSAMGMKIIHEWYKIKLTREQIRREKLEIERLSKQHENGDTKDVAKSITLQRDERLRLSGKEARIILHALNSKHITGWIIGDHSGDVVITEDYREAIPDIQIQEAIDQFKYWITHYNHSKPSYKDHYENDSEPIALWLDHDKGAVTIDCSYQKYVSLCMHLHNIGFSNQPWLLSIELFTAICKPYEKEHYRKSRW